MTKRLEDIRLPYRHFERSEKSLSFAAQWSMCGNPKWEACHQENFGHRHYLYAAELRSFDSVLLFQISHFLTYDIFLCSG